MKYLLDTNILLRYAETKHPHHEIARDAIHVLQNRDAELAITPQVVYEYWVVVTRPLAQNGIGMTSAEAHAAIEEWLDTLSFLTDSQQIFSLWLDLVTQHQVLGKKAHDARLAATAIYYECDGIVTFNAPDFQRFAPLKTLTPEQVLLA